MALVDTVTIPGVELVRVGTWHGSIDGKPAKVSITKAHLADALKAAADREVDAAPIKVGHTSKLIGDGAPALGWLTNFRLADQGRRLVADIADVPAKFAKLMPKAFRRRSAELAYGVRTPAGRRYSMAVQALSVLGVSPPAVKGLADVEALYGLSDGDLDAEHVAVALAAGDLDAEAVAALDAAIDALDALGLEEPQRARLTAELEEAAGIRDASIPPPAPAPGQDDPAGQQQQEPPAMPIDETRIRELLGAAEDADLEKLLQDVKAKADRPELTPEQQAALDALETSETDENAGELVGAGALSQAVLSELKANGLHVLDDKLLEELRAPAVQLAAATKARVFDEAVRAGKIGPKAEREALEKLYDADPEATTALLGTMGQRYAVASLGSAEALDAVDDDEFAEFEASLGLPELEPEPAGE